MVDGVSLTGSLGAGMQVGAAAAAGSENVLELGGSDPFLVLDDVDVDAVASQAVQSRFVNCGQSCVASKRFVVMKKIAQEFTDRFVHYMQAMKAGNPMDESTDIGPLATEEAAYELSRQIADAKQKGATVVEGPPIPSQGMFFRPVAILNAKKNMLVAQEETFGPIAPIFVVKDEEEMIELANSTEFGLGATIWSKDIEKAQALARRIESGFVGINKPVKSDPRLPFGGTKKSGVGRELSHYGVLGVHQREDHHRGEPGLSGSALRGEENEEYRTAGQAAGRVRRRRLSRPGGRICGAEGRSQHDGHRQ